MRSRLKAGLAAAFAAILIPGHVSTVSAQSPNQTDFAEQQLYEATELRKKVQELYKSGRYSDAVPIAQKVLAIRERVLGRNHPSVSEMLAYLGLIYRRQGRYADAEPLLQRALAISENSLGHDHPNIASPLSNLALLYYSQGRYAEAEILYQRALTIREKAFGRDHPNIAGSLNDLAALYYIQARYADAEPLYQRSLAIHERLGRADAPLATTLNNLAVLYQHQGRYGEAEPLFRRALAIREKVFGRDHFDVAESLNNLASLYDDEARYAEGKQLFQQSLAIYEKAVDPNHPDVARVLNNFAMLYVHQGRYEDARPLLQRALAARENSLNPNHPDVAQSLTNLAELYWREGRYGDAEPLYRRAISAHEKILGHDHPDLGTSLNNLALLYSDQGRYTDAEPLYQRSLKIYEKALGADNPAVAASLNNLASLARRQGRYGEAEPLYRRSIAIREKTLGTDHPYVIESLNSLALLYTEQKRYAEALPIVKQTLSQGAAQTVVALPVLFASQAQHLIRASQALADSYETVQRASSSAAANAVSKLAARFAASDGELAQLVRKDQDLTAEAEALDKTVVVFVSKPPAQRSTVAEEQVRKRIEAVKAERDRLQQIFNERFPEYVALSKPQPMPLAETQALLSDDEALLIFDFGAKSYAWIITRSDADWTELKISARDLYAQVRTLRAWLTDPRKRFNPALALKIYQETLGSFAEKIVAKNRLSIVTNGALTSLPPQLLVTKDATGKAFKELDWLIRSHAITVLPSVASLKILRTGSQASSARKPMIAFADPVFSKGARAEAQRIAMRSITSFYRGTQIDVAALGEYLPQLPGTRREVQQVATELNAAEQDLRFGLSATETAVKQAKLDQYRIVYFATHGLVAGELEPFTKSKAEPVLVLTVPDKPNDLDDGLLTASEIAQLKLDADWAVLSACNTAAEDKPGAEALSGLARAFFYAGARSLIVSHWGVEDEATARLMVGTFRALTRDPKLSHAEALRQSILTMIDAAKSDADADPLLWAPFVVVGEPEKPR